MTFNPPKPRQALNKAFLKMKPKRVMIENGEEQRSDI